MKEYTAYLFDADGTLLDTKGPILAAFLEVGRQLNEKMPPDNEISATIGLPLYKQVRAIFGEGRDPEFYDKASTIYGDSLMANYKKTLKTFPGVDEGLEKLQKMGKKLAVVTSRRILSLEAFLETTKIDRFFDILVTAGDTKSHKPGPEPALLAVEKLGVKADECVFIGDATFDVQCGHAAGMDTVLVAWGENSPEGWEVQPDYIAHKFEDLLPDGK